MNAWNSKNVTRFVLPACLTVFALLAQTASAANLTWNNAAATGEWNTTDANWTGDSTIFTNGGVDDVTFNGTAPGTITIAANMNPASTTVTGSSNDTFTGGPISGTGALNKSGSGSLTLLSPNTFTGGINFAGGEISIENANQLGSSAALINVTANSMLTVTNPNTNGTNVANPMNIAAGTVMTFNRGASQPSPTYSGKISGLGSIEITKNAGIGGNSWTFNNATNDFAGNISINGSTSAATFSNDGSMGGASLITLNGGSLTFGASVVGTGRTVNVVGSGNLGSSGGMFKGLVTGAGISVGNLGLDNANNSMASIFNNIGTLKVGVAGSLGAGSVSYTSNAGNFLVFVDPVGGTFNNTLNMSSGNNRTLEVTNANATITWNGNITDTGLTTNFVKKLGPGTFISSNWSVTRQLDVDAGRFLLNDSTTSNLGDIVVANGATFGGTGNLVFAAGKSLTVNGTLQPGSNGAGTLSVFGPLNLTPTTMLDFELGASGDDLIQVNGNLVLDGSLQVTPNGSFGQEGSTFTLFTYTGTLTDNGLDLIGLPNGVLVFSPGEISLFFPIPIPEPATAWLIGLPVLVCARKLRKNRK